MSRDQIVAIQRKLYRRGLWAGAINGIADARLGEAILNALDALAEERRG